MNHPHLAFLLCSAGLVAFTGTASAQNSVVSTRIFNDQVFDLTSSFDSGSGQYDLQMGLTDINRNNGTPVLVEIDLELTWDVDLSITNNSTIRGGFGYSTPIDLSPVAADCQAYDFVGLSGIGPAVDPGEVSNLIVDQVSTLGFTGSTFETFCGVPWWWESATVWTSILDSTPRITGPFGGGVPGSWIEVNKAEVRVTGFVRVLWAPTPLAFQSICPGTETPAVTLEPAGGLQNQPDVYLFQSGAPASFNLLARSDGGTSTVNPISGLCLTGNVARVPGSGNFAGAPIRLPDVAALSGSLTYFQSWFRTPGMGTSGTSECIALQFP